MQTHAPITELLRAWRIGDEKAGDDVVRVTYPILRRLAGRRLRRERGGHTLQPTALVHEAYLRLLHQRRVPCESRGQFVALCSRLMNRVLLDHARARDRDKRGGGWIPVSLDEAKAEAAQAGPSAEIAAAVRRLASVDPLKAAIVDLRYGSGMTLDEAAVALGCSRVTVARHWRMARAWLRRQLLIDANAP